MLKLLLITTNLCSLTLWLCEHHKCKQLESKLLRMKLSPHFLFNRLTELHSKIYFNDKELASNVLDMAQHIRYHLEHLDHYYVPLSKELEHWKKSIQLYTKNLSYITKIKCHLPKDFDENLKIIPALFDDILYNCFKRVKKTDGYIHLNVAIYQKRYLLFFCENNYDLLINDSLQTGIKSLKKLLQLHYRGKSDFRIQKDNSHFQIRIKLRLS